MDIFMVCQLLAESLATQIRIHWTKAEMQPVNQSRVCWCLYHWRLVALGDSAMNTLTWLAHASFQWTNPDKTGGILDVAEVDSCGALSLGLCGTRHTSRFLFLDIFYFMLHSFFLNWLKTKKKNCAKDHSTEKQNAVRVFCFWVFSICIFLISKTVRISFAFKPYLEEFTAKLKFSILLPIGLCRMPARD